MGRIYLEHLGGTKLYSCAECKTFISNREELFSRQFLPSTERIYLFKKVVNVTYSEKPEVRTIQLSNRNGEINRLPEKHFIRDVFCKVCSTKLGFVYEFISSRRNQEKEGKTVIEKTMLIKENGNIKEYHNNILKSSVEEWEKNNEISSENEISDSEDSENEENGITYSEDSECEGRDEADQRD